jgi:hypothetical protein
MQPRKVGFATQRDIVEIEKHGQESYTGLALDFKINVIMVTFCEDGIDSTVMRQARHDVNKPLSNSRTLERTIKLSRLVLEQLKGLVIVLGNFGEIFNALINGNAGRILTALFGAAPRIGRRATLGNDAFKRSVHFDFAHIGTALIAHGRAQGNERGGLVGRYKIVNHDDPWIVVFGGRIGGSVGGSRQYRYIVHGRVIGITDNVVKHLVQIARVPRYMRDRKWTD